MRSADTDRGPFAPGRSTRAPVLRLLILANPRVARYEPTAPGKPGEKVSLYLFNNAFSYFQLGYASAMSWVLFFIILALSLLQLKLAPRWVYYEGENR